MKIRPSGRSSDFISPSFGYGCLLNCSYCVTTDTLITTPDGLKKDGKIQEAKTSEYGGMNIRYKLGLKSDMIAVFKDLHGCIIPWNQIRYIF